MFRGLGEHVAGVDGGPGGAEAMMINLQWNVIAEPGSYFFPYEVQSFDFEQFLNAHSW